MPTRKTLTARIPADLIRKVYAAEGWPWDLKAQSTALGAATRMAQVNRFYDVTVDHRRDRYVATPKVA
jgi:hypothetical protein